LCFLACFRCSRRVQLAILTSYLFLFCLLLNRTPKYRIQHENKQSKKPCYCSYAVMFYTHIYEMRSKPFRRLVVLVINYCTLICTINITIKCLFMSSWHQLPHEQGHKSDCWFVGISYIFMRRKLLFNDKFGSFFLPILLHTNHSIR